MMSKEAMKLALEALDIVKIHFTQNRHVNDAITTLREALASEAKEQPAQPDRVRELECVIADLKAECQELRAAQPAREPLTDEEIEKLREKTFSTGNPYCPVDSKSMRKAARAIEAAHNIKE